MLLSLKCACSDVRLCRVRQITWELQKTSKSWWEDTLPAVPDVPMFFSVLVVTYFLFSFLRFECFSESVPSAVHHWLIDIGLLLPFHLRQLCEFELVSWSNPAFHSRQFYSIIESMNIAVWLSVPHVSVISLFGTAKYGKMWTFE